jgi:hypothetical protein
MMELEVVKMPIHDWTRVSAGTWHAFHLSWISEIQASLNDGRLPPDYYAQAEQIAGPWGPDVLTLQEPAPPFAEDVDPTSEGGLAVAIAPPRVRQVEEVELEFYHRRRRTLVIRHSSGDRIIALLEIVSPGNKASQSALRSFVGEAVEAIERGFHLLIVDLFPPTPRDPQGMHAAIWGEIRPTEYELPANERLTLVAYAASNPTRAYIEPTAVGHELIEMPLFLTPERYINVPLEATYQAAYRGVPRRWRDVLESSCS